MSNKPVELRAEIADELRKRLPALALVEGFDSNGDPTIALGAGTTQTASAFIRVKAADDPLSTDGLGLPSTRVAPCVIELVTEASDGSPILIISEDQSLQLLGTLLRRGVTLDWYVTANATVPTVAGIIAANFKSTFDPEFYWPLLGSN